MASIPGFDPNGLVKGAIWILVSISGVFLSLRLYCKRRGRGFHWDDGVLITSFIALLGNVVLMTMVFDISASQKKPPSRASVDTLAILGLTSLTLAITSQSWSKMSFAMTLLRISEGWMSYFLWFAIISMNILFGLGALFFWTGCTPLEKAWHPLMRGTCRDPWFHITFGIVVSGMSDLTRPDIGARYRRMAPRVTDLVLGYSGIMDLVFAVIPWRIIMPLNLRPREKLGCAVGMSMGIFAGIAAFIKCSKLPSMATRNAQDSMQLAFWGVAEPAVTIMAACVPAMRVLLKKVAAPKQEFLDEHEGDRLPEPSSNNPNSNSTRLATWGTKMATWASTVATWGSKAASLPRTRSVQ